MVFFALAYAIMLIQRSGESNRPVIVLSEPVDLKTAPSPQTDLPASEPLPQTDTPSDSQTPSTSTPNTPTPPSKTQNSTVVWEMSQADPTKRSTNTQGLPPPADPTPSGTAPSDTLAQDTPAQTKTPLSNQMGNQAILHPDDVPAVEHSALPHLRQTTKNDVSSIEITRQTEANTPTHSDKQALTETDTPEPTKQAEPTTKNTDNSPTPNDNVLQGVKQLLEDSKPSQ